jgi:hypothetical protein
MIEARPLRTLALVAPSRPGRPAHVSAASGLARVGEHLYVVADDENHLAIFPAMGGEPGTLKRIFAGQLPIDAEARKRNKADVETITRLPASKAHPHGALLLLGSCSRRERCSGALLGLDAAGQLDGTRALVDLGELHDAFEARYGRLNIEGALASGDELLLLQRGNKRDRRNARIHMRLGAAVEAMVTKQRLGIEPVTRIESVDLGAIDDVPLCFTDGAALPDGRMVFTAVAEDTHDSYADGACRGAAIGVMSAQGTLELLEPLAGRFKVEGVEATLESGLVKALLVTDADDADIPASLLACEFRAT